MTFRGFSHKVPRRQSRRRSSQRSPHGRSALLFVALFCAGVSLSAQSRGELVERTLAIVGGSAITLSDVQTALALGFVDGVSDVAAASERLVERTLILREVERYAPPEPEASRIDERLSQVRDRMSGTGLESVLTAGGFTEARLRAWLRDDLRIAAYLNQRFAADGPERRESLIQDWVVDLRRRTPVVELWRK